VSIFREREYMDLLWDRLFSYLDTETNKNKVKVNQVRVSGGEPTVLGKRALEEILHSIRKLMYFDGKLILQTNGTIYFEHKYIDEYWISLYGGGEYHDYITRVKGSFERTMHTIKTHIEKGHVVVLQTPVFDEEQVTEYRRLRNKYPFLEGVPVRLTRLLPHGSARYLDVPLLDEVQSQRIAEIFPEPKIITCSITQKNCNRNRKLTILPNGKVVDCASCKRGKDWCRK